MVKYLYPQLDTHYKHRSHNIFKRLIIQNLPLKSTILDIGCGFGAVGALVGNSFQVIGIEKYQEYLKLAQKHYYKIYQLDLNYPKEINQITETKFDMIIFGDVLEHLLEPDLVIDSLLKKLSAKGLLIISLPNIAQLPYRIKHLFGKFEYSNSGIMDRTHLHFFTLKTAKQFISNHKLKIISINPAGTAYSFFPYFPTLIASQFVFLCQKI